MEVQAQIPVGLAALHNFICIHDPKEGPIIRGCHHHFMDDSDVEGEDDYVAPALWGQNGEEMNKQQDQIAEAMWANYVKSSSNQSWLPTVLDCFDRFWAQVLRSSNGILRTRVWESCL